MVMKASRPKLPPLARSLSARLLLLTVVFVMLAEVLIYAPSAARFRLTYLEQRIAAAHIAVLALLATPDFMVSDELEQELLHHADSHVIGLKRPDGIKLMLGPEPPPAIDASFDLRNRGFFPLIAQAFETLAQRENRLLRIVGPSPKHPQAIVEIVIDEAPMRMALIYYSQRIVALSVFISIITAALLYLVLQWLMVRPLRRLVADMMAFREDPEDVLHIGAAGRRTDEIGVAEREFADMQAALRAALHQKTRLAALGAAVTKINHDLRNILATAQLMADRLADSDNPEVRRVTPRLLAAIDRAAHLCSNTLNFTREGPPLLARSRFAMRALVEDVGQSLPAGANGATPWCNAVPPEIEVEADRDQLFRVLANLGQNAVEAGATRIEVTAERRNRQLRIEMADNGPGLSPRARERLFQPFAGSARPGGSGLGLAIARDLMHAHGGEIRLLRSTAEGTVFALELPVDSPQS